MGDSAYQDQNKAKVSAAGAANVEQNTAQQANIATQTAADQSNAASEHDYLLNQFKGYGQTGGISAADKAALLATGQPATGAPSSGGGGGGSGSTSTMASSPFQQLQLPQYASEYAGFQNLAQTGGVDISTPTNTYNALQGANAGLDFSGVDTANQNINTAEGNITNSIGNLNTFAGTGGVTSADMAQLNRPYYSELEQTGGYSDAQLADIRKRSNASVPSFYNNLQDQLNQRRQVQGYSSGFDSTNQNLMRTSAQQSADQQLNTETTLAENIKAGKLQGAQALSQNELSLLGITTPAKEAALAAAGGLGVSQGQIGIGQGNMNISQQSLIAQTKLAAANGDVEAQRLLQSGIIAGLGGMTGVTAQAYNDALQRTSGIQQYGLTEDQIRAQLAAASGSTAAQLQLGYANINAGNERYLIGAQQQGQQYGDTGALDLYKAAPGTQAIDWAANQSSINSEAAAQQSMFGDNQSGTGGINWGSVASGVGAVAGGVAAFA